MQVGRFLCATLIAAACCATAQAQETPDKKLRFLAGVGYTWGGDTLANVTLYPTSGSGPTYDEDLSAGAGLDLHLGGAFQLGDRARILGIVAYHNDQANGHSANASYHRVPVELIGQWRATDNFWIGLGVRKALFGTIHREAGFTSGGSGTPTLPAQKWDLKFSPAFLIEGEYMMSKNWGLKMRAVKEKGELKGTSEKFNADHVGAFVTYYFD